MVRDLTRWGAFVVAKETLVGPKDRKPCILVLEGDLLASEVGTLGGRKEVLALGLLPTTPRKRPQHPPLV